MRRRASLLAPHPSAACAVLGCVLVCSCGDSEETRRPSDVVAEVSDEISTVVSVTWRTDLESIGYVEYGVTRDMDQNTPLETDESRDHALSVLGLLADTDYYYRVITWDADGAAASEIETFRTGALPASLPSVEQEGGDHAELIVAPLTGEASAVVVMDPDGNLVWYHLDDRGFELRRARISFDGSSVLYGAAGPIDTPADDSEIVRVALDGSESSAVTVPGLGFDFVEHEDGTLAALVAETRDFEGEPLRGDQIVEIDSDGELTTIWSAWDCFDPADVPGDDPELGWTFANALDYDAEQDKYFVGLRNLSSIVKVDRASGECDWVLGAAAGTIEFADEAEPFLHQSQFHVRGTHVIVLDGGPDGDSRVLDYQLDEEANTVTQVWSYVPDPSVDAGLLGQPTRLADGNETFINWGEAGKLERVTPDGESLWSAQLEPGYSIGYHTLVTSLYQE